MKITDHPSPNFGPRAEGKKPSLLILHYTETKTTEEALEILQSAERRVSSHYLIGDRGEIIRLVGENLRAWHAGKSYWAGETDINSCSIGIEIQNLGHAYGYALFPDVQMQAVKELCRDIVARHKILPHNVLAHSDVAPDRKRDPGELFPWKWLAENGVGIWPQEDSAETADILSLLTRYGYNPETDIKTLITAFQRHFEPEVFRQPDTAGIPSSRTLQRLKSLLRLKT